MSGPSGDSSPSSRYVALLMTPSSLARPVPESNDELDFDKDLDAFASQQAKCLASLYRYSIVHEWQECIVSMSFIAVAVRGCFRQDAN